MDTQEFDFLTSRSEYLAYQTCHRLRLLQCHTGSEGLGSVGVGWSPAKASIPLAKGSAVHLGLQRLLEGASPDEAVQDALREFDSDVLGRGLHDVREADQEYTFHEQKAVAEVAVRVWAQRRLPYFKSTYRVLAIEREAPVAQLAHGIGFQSRADGILERLDNGNIEILSFKTASTWRRTQDEENENDVQGLSEAWTASKVYGRADAILMEYLVLGARKYAKPPAPETDDPLDAEEGWSAFEDRGPKLQDSFLVRPWLVGPNKWAWRTKVRGPEGTSITAARMFDPNFGTKGKARTESLMLHGEWSATKTPVWEHMELKDWVELLTSQQVWPYNFDPLAHVCVSRSYSRQAFELEDWRREAGWQEARVREGVQALEHGHPMLSQQEVLDSYFDRNRKACGMMFGAPCQFKGACWKGEVLGQSPRYVPRQPNHPLQVVEE